MVRDKTPQPRTNPAEPKYRNEDDKFSMDIEHLDGVGKQELDNVDFSPFIALHRNYSCDREGCDATGSDRLLFAMEDISGLSDYDEEDIESVSATAEIVDFNVVRVKHPRRKNVEFDLKSRDGIQDKPSYTACTGKPPRDSPY